VITRFSTLTVPEADRSAVWEAWNESTLIGLRCWTRDGHGLRGQQTNLVLPQLTIARVLAAPHQVTRSTETIDAHPTGAVALCVSLRGHSRFTDQRYEGGLSPGRALLMDADRPFIRSFGTAFSELVVKIPRAVCARWIGAPLPNAAAVTPDPLAAARAQVLTHCLSGATNRSTPTVDVATLQVVALDLVRSLVTGVPGDRLPLAHALIEQHLHDTAFSAGALATVLGISDRQLSRLFAADATTFPRDLTRRRLVRAKSMLAQTDHPVAEIARRCGFSSPAYFSRVFGDSIGVTPQHSRNR
jgi:AraC-like DNA-binding protein